MTSNINGFTLIELMIAVTLVSLVLVAVTQIFISSMVGAAKADAITRVKNNGDAALVAIERAIRSGKEIDNCNSGSLTFAALSPSAGGGTDLIDITIKKGSNRIIITEDDSNRYVTDNSVIVDELVFNCLEGGVRRDKVRVSFTLVFNPGAKASRSVKQTFTSSVMMRNR